MFSLCLENPFTLPDVSSQALSCVLALEELLLQFVPSANGVESYADAVTAFLGRCPVGPR
jgi:hypothetical protein